MPNQIRDNMRIERLIGRKFKASLGPAQGTGKTEKQAKDACEKAALSIMINEGHTQIEIRDGYLIVSRVTDIDQGWYLIKRLTDAKNGFLYPQCFMRASGLKAAIESHLLQYKADATVSEPHTVSEPSNEPWCEGCNRPISRCLCNPIDTVRTAPYTGEPMSEGQKT